MPEQHRPGRARTLWAWLLRSTRVTLTAGALLGVAALAVAATRMVGPAPGGLPAASLAASSPAGAADPAVGYALTAPDDPQRDAVAMSAARAAAERARTLARQEAARSAARSAAAARAAAAKVAAARAAAARRARAEKAALAAAISDPRGAARVLAARRGWGSGQFRCLDSLWQRESGWNYRATNPSSGAYGIPQALPGRKMSSAGADWRTNPVTQIRWGLQYIATVYGTPCGAWAHSRATGWY